MAKTDHPKMVSHFLKLNVVMYAELTYGIDSICKETIFLLNLKG